MVTIAQKAHQIVFMVSIYPDQPLTKIATMFQMPAIDINSAIWYAIDNGWLVDNGDGNVPDINSEATHDLGEGVESLQEMIMVALKQVATAQKDIEEGFLIQWCQGHPTHNLLFAIKDLIRTGEIATYSVDDMEEDGKKSTYTFYSLPENVDHRWGEKEFKDVKKLQPTDPQTALDAIKEDELPDAPAEKSGPTMH